MAINVRFDLTNNPEPPTIVLARRNGDKLGQLEARGIELNDKFNDASEISFTLYKYADGKLANHWDDVVDFKLVYCKEWDMWFEIKVELDEENETTKTVFCTQLGQAELSQLMLYNIHINEEGDSNWDTNNKSYKSTILYNPKDTQASLLHRLLKDKAPHYSIIHVDDTIKNIQRTFSFDETSIYDAFMEIAEEIGCLFVFHSNSDKNGKIQRTISVYDLQQKCLNHDCGYRGEFTDKCPKCGSTDIDYGYGIDTTIFVTSDELASGGIQLTTDFDSVKNCFKLEAGDDLMTATVRNCNPNGTDYIWHFSDAMKDEMSEELVKALEDYDELYKDIYNNYKSEISVSKYNALVKDYEDRYNASSVRCLNCGYKGNFENACPECGSNDFFVGDKLQTITTPIKGYPALMNAYYNAIDLALYLESGLMPNVDISDDLKAKDYAALLTSAALSPVAVNVDNVKNVSLATADSAVLSMAKIIVAYTYKVEVNTSTLSDDKIWKGNFKITNYSDDSDTYVSKTISVKINNDTETFIEQKIEKALNKKDTDDLSISGLFKKDYEDFRKELDNYSLNSLKSFYDACDACLVILQEQNVSNKESWSDEIYDKLYKPYLNKSRAISSEIKVREREVNSINGVYDETDEDNKVLITKGLKQRIEDCRDAIQESLNFEKYLGVDLWLELCSHRREDKYSNDNYISDGLNNADLFSKASEFVKVANDEIFKSAELQRSISTTLNNLLAIPKFKPLIKYFSVGNWLRIKIDEQVYKLRLIEYGINFDDFDNIPVEFSDVTNIRNGITDVQEILSQASSMATSYSYVKKQASQGEESNAVINNWFANGLNATNTKIVSNAGNQNQVWDENGFLCREYNSITGEYSKEQLKIINSTITITDDDWENTKTAIGKYFYTDPLTGELKTAYGVNGETIIGKLLVGEDLIISNKDGKLEFNDSGLIVTGTGHTVAVKPNSNSVFSIKNNSTNDYILHVNNNGNLVVTGDIIATSLKMEDGSVIEGITVGDISGLHDVAISGSYNDLENRPNLKAVATSGSYNDLTNKPTYATVASTGSYNDLSNKPSLATVATSGSYNDLSNKPSLKAVATSGSYNDLSNRPSLKTVATSGSYNDLVDIDELKNWVNQQIQNAINS